MLSSSLNLLLENAIIYMDEQLNLLSIKEGLPGMHKDLCSHYYSACMTTLHRAGHIVNGTILHLDGNRKGSIPLYWEDYLLYRSCSSLYVLCISYS